MWDVRCLRTSQQLSNTKPFRLSTPKIDKKMPTHCLADLPSSRFALRTNDMCLEKKPYCFASMSNANISTILFTYAINSAPPPRHCRSCPSDFRVLSDALHRKKRAKTRIKMHTGGWNYLFPKKNVSSNSIVMLIHGMSNHKVCINQIRRPLLWTPRAAKIPLLCLVSLSTALFLIVHSRLL